MPLIQETKCSPNGTIKLVLILYGYFTTFQAGKQQLSHKNVSTLIQFSFKLKLTFQQLSYNFYIPAAAVSVMRVFQLRRPLHPIQKRSQIWLTFFLFALIDVSQYNDWIENKSDIIKTERNKKQTTSKKKGFENYEI